MANPRFTTRWGLASDERVRSPRSIEHCPPGAQSIAHYSESFVEEKLSPPKPWLDSSEDDQRRFHTISAPWESLEPGHGTLATVKKRPKWGTALGVGAVWRRFELGLSFGEGAPSPKSTSPRILRQWSHHNCLVKTQGNKPLCPWGFLTPHGQNTATSCKLILFIFNFLTPRKSKEFSKPPDRHNPIQLSRLFMSLAVHSWPRLGNM